MKKNLLLLIGITFFQLAIAQNPYLTDYKYSFRINNLSTLSKDFTPIFVPATAHWSRMNGARYTNQFQLFHPTYAFDWQSKRKNTHELELIDLILNRAGTKQYRPDSMYTIKTNEQTYETAISLRYEYRINFCTNKESRWVPALGFSFNPYYRYAHTSITGAATYKTSIQTFGIRVAFNPSITYFITKRLYVNAALSLTMLDFSRSTYTNPYMEQQPGPKDKNKNYDLKGIKDKLEFKVGIGYKF